MCGLDWKLKILFIMNKNLGLILKDTLLAAVLTLCPAMFLSSCSYDDGAGDCPDSGGLVSLQLQITAEQETDLNTRVDFTGEESGTTGEYMHNLCVLFVSADGTIVWKTNAKSMEGNTAAKSGNLRTYSEPLQISQGTYTVYAFANIDTYYNESWASLTGVGTGTTLTELEKSGIDIDNIVLEDPAAKLNFAENRFIPMSAKQRVVINEQTTAVSIGLDRLVSKVRVDIHGKPGSTLKSFTFGNYADRVGLFSGQALSGVEYNSTKNIFEQKTFPENGEVSLTEFYVNETPAHGDIGFTVELETDEMGGTKYSSVTKTTLELPRNSILPLDLMLNDYGLDLSGWYSIAPIDHAPVIFTADFDTQDSYSVEVPEGAQFGFTVNGVTLGQDASTPTSYYWFIDDAVRAKGFAFDDYSNESQQQEVKGYVTASKDQTFPFTVQVEWENGGNYNRTYTVNVKTTDASDVDYSQADNGTRSESTKIENLKPEVLNMFIKK